MKDCPRTFIVAEAGVNHNGSFDMAKLLVDKAAEARADAVKFQTFKSERVVSRFARKAEYQKRTTGAKESQLEMAKRLELDEDQHRRLLAHCKERGIVFLSTAFDEESLRFLVRDLKISRLKISSGEITNAPFLIEAACAGLPMVLSTGMSTLDDVEEALGVLAYGLLGSRGVPRRARFREALAEVKGQALLREKVILLHCTTEYPAPLADVHLRAMDTLATSFRLPVGYSDHTEGISVPVAAVARGAVYLEKHFTLDRSLPGPDHKASLEPVELAAMVRAIRDVEVALGRPLKSPAPSEAKNIPIARKSLVAARRIVRGEKFTAENLAVKRPGDGISPMRYWEWLGKVSDRDYELDETIIPS